MGTSAGPDHRRDLPRPLLVGYGLERRLSQGQLSLVTGVHRNYIGAIERAERTPSVTTVWKLAMALDVKLSDLFQRVEAASR